MFEFLILRLNFWSNPDICYIRICGFNMTEYGSSSGVCLPAYPVDRRRSTTMEPRMNEEARKATTAVHGARDDPGSRESSQLTGDSCDLNLARSRKKEGSGERPGKNRGVPPRWSSGPESVCLSAPTGDQDTLNNSSPGSNAGSHDRPSPCAPTLFPRDTDVESKFTRPRFRRLPRMKKIKRSTYIVFRVVTKIIAEK